MLGRLLTGGLGAAQLLLQACGVLLQGQQGGLPLFVLADALVQLAVLLGQPGIPSCVILVEQLRGERVRLKLRRLALLLGEQVFLLLQQFLLLGDDAADLGAQVGQLLLERIHRFLRVGLFAFIMAAEALQQCFGLVVGVIRAAAHRAGLIILQLRAQFFDAGAAGQALTLQQFTGDGQGLLGDRQFVTGFHPVLGQAFAFLLGAGLALLQLGQALVQGLLAAPQSRQLFEGAQLFAVVLQQVA